jgi:serine/threonine-protein kinase
VARSLIENDGLKAEVVYEDNDQVPEGQVFGQNPPEGNKLEKDETVSLQISAGKGQEKVPDVRGETLDDAQARLSDAGFNYRVRQETSDSVDPGKVTHTDPSGGTSAEKGATVELFVSTGKEQVEVPDVAGQDPVEAANTLGARDLSVERVNQASDTVDEGKVIGTDPPGGTAVPKGSRVKLIVSTGTEQVRVPNVVGLSRGDATTELQNAGFTVVVREVTSLDPANAGRVIAQSPSPDSKAAKGSAVTISVGKLGSTTTSSSTTTTSSFP